jgi:hypothetical protein
MFNLDGHQETGGFAAYHYPGLPASSVHPKDEIDVMETFAQSIKELQFPRNLTSPNGPQWLPLSNGPGYIDVSWLGVAGARNYSIVARNQTVMDGILENKVPIVRIQGELIKKIQNQEVEIVAFGDWGTVRSPPKVLVL